MHCAWPGDYHSLGLTRIQFHPPKVTPRSHSDEVTVQGLSCSNSSAWGRHNSHESGDVSITNKLILQNGKKFRGVQKEQQRVQNTALRHSWHNVVLSPHRELFWGFPTMAPETSRDVNFLIARGRVPSLGPWGWLRWECMMLRSAWRHGLG